MGYGVKKLFLISLALGQISIISLKNVCVCFKDYADALMCGERRGHFAEKFAAFTSRNVREHLAPEEERNNSIINYYKMVQEISCILTKDFIGTVQ